MDNTTPYRPSALKDPATIDATEAEKVIARTPASLRCICPDCPGIAVQIHRNSHQEHFQLDHEPLSKIGGRAGFQAMLIRSLRL